MNAAAIDARAVLRLAPRYRLQWEEVQQAWVLLYPEGMVKLNGSAAEILRRIDGRLDVAGLIAGLQADFAPAGQGAGGPGETGQAEGLAADVLDFLAHAQRQGWLGLASAR